MSIYLLVGTYCSAVSVGGSVLQYCMSMYLLVGLYYSGVGTTGAPGAGAPLCTC